MTITAEERILQATRIVELIDELEAENVCDSKELDQHIETMQKWAEAGDFTDIELALESVHGSQSSAMDKAVCLLYVRDWAKEAL